MDIFIIRDGQQTGPFNENTVQSLLRDGGLRSKDLAWHKGLSGWAPVGEVLNPSPEKPPAHPPGSAVPTRASAKQKALLKYLGATMEEDITRAEAALAISDAMENPKAQARLAKWQDEKLRLHPEVFQDELDFRRANRVARYLELCQTEGAEVVRDITKAHVQVLVESLDKKQSDWETDSRAPLWDFLLPSVAEYFPQLIKDEWKGKLIFGGKSKVAEAIAKTSGVVGEPPVSLGPIQAAIRGIIYGTGVLLIAIGGHYLYKNSGPVEPAAKTAANSAQPVPQPTAGDPAPSPAPAPEPARELPTDAPLIAANEPATPPPAPDLPPAPAAPAADAQPAPSDPAMAEKPAEPVNPTANTPPPASAAVPNFSPAPAPGAPAPEPSAAPSAPAAPVAPAASAATAKTAATLKQAIGVTLPNGRVTLPAGTKLRILSYDGQNIRVAWNNNIFNVPVIATDASETVALTAPPPTAPPPAVSPTGPGVAKKPSLPSSDL